MLVNLRKVSVILPFLLIAFLSILAQAPQQMSYQAVIRNSADAVVASQNVGMQISILQGSASGTVVYAETQIPTTNANGLVTLAIGTGNVSAGIFTAINWAAGPYFIKTETDPSGGTNYTITGTSQLMSVPYALYAASSGAAPAPAPNFVYSYTAPPDLDVQSIVSIGGVNFRITSAGHIEVQSNGSVNVLVFSTWKDWGASNPAPTEMIYGGKLISQTWSSLIIRYDHSEYNMSYYNTHDCEVSVYEKAGIGTSFRVHAICDGYGKFLLRVEYFH